MDVLKFYGLEGHYTIKKFGAYSRLYFTSNPKIFTIIEKSNEVREALFSLLDLHRVEALPSTLEPLFIFRLMLGLCKIIPPQNNSLHFETPDKHLQLTIKEGGVGASLVIGKTVSGVANIKGSNAFLFAYAFKLKKSYKTWLTRHFGKSNYENLWTFPLEMGYINTDFMHTPLPLRPLPTLTEKDLDHPIFDNLRNHNVNFFQDLFKVQEKGSTYNTIQRAVSILEDVYAR